jgi:hypothetical protein
MSPAELDSFTGVYTDRPGEKALRITMRQDQGGLLFSLPDRPTSLHLQPISPNVFVMPHTDARFTFQKDNQGRVTGAIFRVGDGEKTLVKDKS